LIAASVALAARVVLAAVLTVSAIAKLRSRDTVRTQVAALGSDDGRLAAVVSALPAVELLVAVALVAAWSAVPGIVALLLLAVFTGVLIRAQARHVPCACFGAGAGDAPVGPASIVRNGVLAALAVLAVGDPSGASAGATVGFAVLFGAVAAGAVRAASRPGADPEARSLD
jgi:hypothetical protein